MLQELLKSVNPRKLNDLELLAALVDGNGALTYVKAAREVFLTGEEMHLYNVAVTLDQFARLRNCRFITVACETDDMERYAASSRGHETIRILKADNNG